MTKKPRKQEQNARDTHKSLQNKPKTNATKNMRISREKRTKTPKTCVFHGKNSGFCKMLHYP
jgi:hypothetical protein